MDSLHITNELDISAFSKEIAVEYIIDQYGENIKRVIFTYVRNYAQTDDIFQEFLITVFKSLETFKGESKLKTWLIRIAINKCKDYLKSPFNKIAQLKVDYSEENYSKSPEQLSIENEEKQQIIVAIFNLPVKYREIFVLRFYQELSIKEISEVLQLNESTVKTRIARGKEKLRIKLGSDLFEGIK